MTDKKILIAHSEIGFAKDLADQFQGQHWEYVIALNGKESQLKIYQNKFQTVFLDFSLKSHTALEVLNYIKNNHPMMRVYLYFQDRSIPAKLDLDTNLKRMGVADYFCFPTSPQEIASKIAKEGTHFSWQVQKLEKRDGVNEEKEQLIDDDLFISIPLDHFLSGNLACFDIYLKLSSGKYILTLRKGESFENERIANYKNHKTELVYFKKSERLQMIDYYNHLTSKLIELKNSNDAVISTSLKTTHKFIFDELTLTGPDEKIVESSKKMVENTVNSIKRIKDLNKFIEGMFERDPTLKNHSYLSCLYTSIICQKLDWVSPRSINDFCVGAMLQNIGLAESENGVFRNEEELSSDEMLQYQKHPIHGYKILSKYNLPETIKQIVLQHHERVDSSGYPSKLGSTKIYPPAKIVYIASKFSELIIFGNTFGLAALNDFIMSRNTLSGCDPITTKALIMAFIKKKTPEKQGK